MNELLKGCAPCIENIRKHIPKRMMLCGKCKGGVEFKVKLNNAYCLNCESVIGKYGVIKKLYYE